MTDKPDVFSTTDYSTINHFLDFSRCVSNQRPLIETGTMGAKGHVQVYFIPLFYFTVWGKRNGNQRWLLQEIFLMYYHNYLLLILQVIVPHLTESYTTQVKHIYVFIDIYCSNMRMF